MRVDVAKAVGTPSIQVVRSGVFKRLGGEFCAARTPTRGILLALSTCTDQAREADCNRWYEESTWPSSWRRGAFTPPIGTRAWTPSDAGHLPGSRGHAGGLHGAGYPRCFWARPQRRSTGGKGRVTPPLPFCMAIRGRHGDRSLYFGRVMVYHWPQGAL